ncbi:MAG: NAD(P)-dependent oxidoreductase [Hyphococcus sp.]|nr:MAG: NAD(P)-dependent oxidoreductase [Marinicaulis sp.]
MDQKLFCFGFGYTARHFADRLRADGWHVAGTTRSNEKAAKLRAQNIEAFTWDGGDIDLAWLEDVSAVLISTPPDKSGCPTFRAAKNAITAHAEPIKWIGYLSTNGVYGDHDGAWVDETSGLRGQSPRALSRIEAEQQWLSLEVKTPVTIFRLPGIYGPGRSAFDTIRTGKAKRIYKDGQVFSRMHVSDIASALADSLSMLQQHEIYNLADDEPAPPQDVISFACELLGVTPPPLVPIEQAGLSEMAKSFYADNKRVSNARMKATLKTRLDYPTYREGLKALLKHHKEES